LEDDNLDEESDLEGDDQDENHEPSNGLEAVTQNPNLQAPLSSLDGCHSLCYSIGKHEESANQCFIS